MISIFRYVIFSNLHFLDLRFEALNLGFEIDARLASLIKNGL